MRNIIILDEKITETSYREWMKADKAFWKKWFNVDAKYWSIRKDFSHYPTYIDEDGDVRPTHSYLKKLVTEVTKNYGKYGAEFVVMAVHEDNWRSSGKLFLELQDGKAKGIWGTNYSNIHHGYHLQYCRWNSNPANTLGTIYHERAHAFDALVMTELGKRLEPIVGVAAWDRDFVHGASPKYDYLRWNENTDGLKLIAPIMREAFDARLQLHVDYINGRITLWQTLKRWFTEYMNKTNGVPHDLVESPHS